MSDRAPASHTDTGEYDNSLWFWKDKHLQARWKDVFYDDLTLS